MLKHDDFKKLGLPDLPSKSHLRITHEILQSPEWGLFIRTKEAAVWFLLCGCIIRGRMSNHGLGKKLFEDYYVAQNKLVARWDQEQIAEKLGYKKSSKGYISSLTKKLEEEWKAIKCLKISPYNKHYINVYELGYVKSDGREVIYLFQELFKRINERNYARFKTPEPAPKHYFPD